VVLNIDIDAHVDYTHWEIDEVYAARSHREARSGNGTPPMVQKDGWFVICRAEIPSVDAPVGNSVVPADRVEEIILQQKEGGNARVNVASVEVHR